MRRLKPLLYAELTGAKQP